MHRRPLLAALPALLLPALLLRAAPASAAIAPAAAASFVNTQLGNVLALVNANAPDKAARLQALMEATVDIPGIAQFCVGRFWRTASPQEQADYSALFHKVLTTNVLGRIGEYQGTTFQLGGTLVKDDTVAVTTTLMRPGNAPNRVDWVVADIGGPKVIDVIAEGTSLRLTQRSDYQSFLQRNNNRLQALIDALRAQSNG
jgi:phospholipid transport system substrate-binding protein